MIPCVVLIIVVVGSISWRSLNVDLLLLAGQKYL